jgi:hypothetical protein
LCRARILIRHIWTPLACKGLLSESLEAKNGCGHIYGLECG